MESRSIGTCTAARLSAIDSAAFINLAETFDMLKQRYVLMLEEDPDDRQLTESALLDLGLDVSVHWVKYSHELFEHLKQHDKPSLILVDYNCTPSPAIEVLKELKSNDEYRHIPTVILGEGLPEHLVRECYSLGANSYILKPSSDKATRDKIETFFRYWLNVVETA
jgi:CheY-like chemotaxis protein